MPPVGDVSDDMMKLALKHRLSQYKQTSRYSPFSQNVARALKVALGGTYFYNTEALSLSGYNLDFEILFDDQHRPIAIPFQWKYRKYDILLNSIGFGGRRGKRKLTTEVLESLKEAERNAHTATLPSSRIHEFNIDPRQTPVHLASDWGLKFSVPDAPVAKKVAVEVDGPVHFASNCNHVMGSTILKQRQLKALGWEVVSVSSLRLNYCIVSI